MVVAVETMVSPEEEPEEKPTAKERLKIWIKEQIDGQRTLRAPDVANLALKELSLDREFMADFGAEMLRTAVYELVLDVITSGRDSANGITRIDGPQSVIAPNQSTDTRASLKRRLAMLERRYSSWYEHVGNQHVALLEMTAAQLQTAEDERRTRVAHESRIADFLAAIRQRLTDGQKVRDGFPNLTDLEVMRNECMNPKDDDSDTKDGK